MPTPNTHATTTPKHPTNLTLEVLVDLQQLVGQQPAQLSDLCPNLAHLGVAAAERLARARKDARQQVLHLLDAVVDGELPEQPVGDARRLLGALPQHVLQEQAVVLAHGGTAVAVGGDLHERDGLDEAAVAHVDGRLDLVLQVRAQVLADVVLIAHQLS